MQENIKKTVVVDVLIMMFLLLMLVEEVTGLFEDEFIGAILIILFIAHIYINRKWLADGIESIKEHKLEGKNFPLVIINAIFYASMIVCSIIGIFSIDIIDFDMEFFDIDFDDMYIFFIFIFITSFILHILTVMKVVEDIIRKKLNIDN